MVFVRIAFIIMIPVLALLVLAFTHIYIQKHSPRKRQRGSEEELANLRHQKTLVDYLQSSHYGDLLREETDRVKEEGEEQDSS